MRSNLATNASSQGGRNQLDPRSSVTPRLLFLFLNFPTVRTTHFFLFLLEIRCLCIYEYLLQCFFLNYNHIFGNKIWMMSFSLVPGVVHRRFDQIKLIQFSLFTRFDRNLTISQSVVVCCFLLHFVGFSRGENCKKKVLPRF